jgi:hypothetical protein
LQTKKLTIADYPSLELANRQSDLKKAIEDIWNGKTDELPTEIFDTYNKNLHKAISGLSPEKEKLLKNNLTRLAAAKANYVTQRLEQCRTARTKEEYLRQARTVINRANSALATEYNTAVHRCRVAKQWERFQRESKLYPNVEWLRTRSATPREVHLTYVGRVWAMNDPFWTNNQPGCTWNCKCDWRTTDKPTTENEGLQQVPVAKGLDGNPYYTDEIFTDKHPYFGRVDKHIPELGVLKNPDEIAYLNQKAGDREYKVHYNARKEFKEANEPYLDAIFKAGYKDVKFLPTIERSEIELRKRYFGKYWESKKCADTFSDGYFLELKTIVKDGKKTRRNIVNALADAGKKSDKVILITDKKLDFDNISRDTFLKHPNLLRITFSVDGKLFDFVKP